MFTLTSENINVESLKKTITNPQSGAFVSFEGWVRNHNNEKNVIELHYEAHEKLACQLGTQIMLSAQQKYSINQAICCHRIGALKVGEMAIWIGVSADHRQAAFLACEYILNETKANVPIWKNEHYTDGNSGWVEANI